MRKIILFMHVTLDGFVGGPNGEMDWATMDDDEIGKYLIGDLLETVDTMILGRNLFQGFQQVWPGIAADPSTKKDIADFANWLINSQKIVFSRTLESVDWTNSTLIKENVAEEIAQLKQQPGKDIVVFGGAGFVASLNELGLIDEYRLKLEPVILGKGLSLFKDIPGRINLELTRSKAFDSGVVGLYYQKKS